jgi:hypothetical protein
MSTTAVIALFALIVGIAVAYLLVRLSGSFIRELERLKEQNVVLRGQVTALGTLMTHVINALDEAPRTAVSNAFKTFLGQRGSVNSSTLSEKEKNTFNQAYSMMVLAIIEEIKSPKSDA